MSELPGRPDLDQLRRQARELLRAATDGEPHALTRLRAVSERVTLSAAQLAVAREYGFPSWPALRTEAKRRRSSERRSFGGAPAIEIASGILSPSVLIIGPGQAVMEASLMPSEEPERLPWPGPGQGPAALRAGAAPPMIARARMPSFDDVLVTDNHGARYTLRVEGMEGPPQEPGQVGPIRLRLGLDPVPARECRWLELRNQDGSATRLRPSERPTVRVSQMGPASGTPAERDLARQALWIISLRLPGIREGQEDQDIRQRCSAALARAAEIRQSGELDPASELPDQIARLCGALTGHHPVSGLPPGWTAMLNAARRTDGPRYHLDITAALPPVNDTAVQLDSLISEPGAWRVHLRASPGWWTYSQDRQRKREAMIVQAEDDLGGMYVSVFWGSTFHGDHEELALRFVPRLDPLADILKLTFTGASEQVAVELAIAPAVKPTKRRTR